MWVNLEHRVRRKSAAVSLNICSARGSCIENGYFASRKVIPHFCVWFGRHCYHLLCQMLEPSSHDSVSLIASSANPTHTCSDVSQRTWLLRGRRDPWPSQPPLRRNNNRRIQGVLREVQTRVQQMAAAISLILQGQNCGLSHTTKVYSGRTISCRLAIPTQLVSSASFFKMKKICFGYFHPEKICLDNKNKLFSGWANR